MNELTLKFKEKRKYIKRAHKLGGSVVRRTMKKGLPMQMAKHRIKL